MNRKFSKIFDTSITIVTLIVVMYFFVSCCVYFMVSPYVKPRQDFAGIFNSNQLMLAHVYKDLILHHHSLKNWIFSPVPFFFPDGLIYFIIMSIVRHMQTAALLSNAALGVIYYLGLVAVGTATCGAKSKNLFRFSALLSLFLACSSLHNQEIFIPMWSSHMGSTVCILLLSFLCLLKLLFTDSNEKSNKKILAISVILSLFIFLTTLSDQFFFVLLISATVPGLFTLYWHKKIDHKKAIQLFLLVFISGILGFLCNSHDLLHLQITSLFRPGATTEIHFSAVALDILYNIFTLYYHDNPTILFITFGIVLFGIKLFFFPGKTKPSIVFIIVSVSFLTLGAFFSSLLLDLDLFNRGFLSLRHFGPSIILPTFLCVFILLSESEALLNIVNRYYWILASLIIISLCLFQPYKSLNNMINYYPPLTHCLDHYAQEGELLSKNGVATHWDARVNAMLSHENLNIVAINKVKKAYEWMSTSSDYKNKKFHFVIVRDATFSSNSAISAWGKPDKILRCYRADNYKIFVYNNGFYIDQNLVKRK